MHEIIHVVDQALEAEASHHDPQIEVVYGPTSLAGYYLILCPARPRDSRHHGKHYLGPFPTLFAARVLQTSAWALGVIHEKKDVAVVTERHSIAPLAPRLRNPISSEKRV